MKVQTPRSTSSERLFIRTSDVVSVFLAAPIAIELRDPGLFLFPGEGFGPAFHYCLFGFSAGLAMLIAFHLGQNVHGHFSARETRSVVLASLSTAALTAVCAFSLDRLDYVPRSVPLIHLLVQCALMLGGRAIATRRQGSTGGYLSRYSVESHMLLIGANDFALSYLKVLDAFNVDRTNIVAILDHNPKLFGRALLGHPIIGPPPAIARVICEYEVHGVEITRVLISENRPKRDDNLWRETEKYCLSSGIELKYLSDVLGFQLGEGVENEEGEQEPEGGPKGYRLIKRTFDLCMSIAMAIAISPLVTLIAVGIIIDLGWPIIFWQKRIGHHGRPFLIFKFRTLRAPYDQQGNFVAEDRRTSRFGSLLRRTQLDELPQLWNIVCGEMSFVGPRPLLPIDQPKGSQLRLLMKPGITGWAQINGGKQVTAEEKGLLDEWYVRHASALLDIGIILRTFGIVLFGDRRNVLPLVEDVSTFGGIGRG